MPEKKKVTVGKPDKNGSRLVVLSLCLVGFLAGATLVAGSISFAQSSTTAQTEWRWYERVGSQASAVWSVIVQTSEQIFAGVPLQIAQIGGAFPIDFGGGPTNPITTTTEISPTISLNGTLRINTPLEVDNTFRVLGTSTLASSTVSGSFAVASDLSVGGPATFSTISTEGIASLNTLEVVTSATIGTLSVAGETNIGGLLETDSITVTGETQLSDLLIAGDTIATELITANGGMVTNGADVNLGSGSLFAANVVNNVIAGENVIITGTQNQPVISVDTDDLVGVLSVNSQTGDISLSGGTDIIVSGLSIQNVSNLSSVRSRGGCAGCITDGDVSSILTITGGSIDGTAIGSTTAASARFTEVVIGTTTSSTTLTVGGAATISDVLSVSGTATSTFGGSINLTSGCFAVNGVCVTSAAPSSYIGLVDTPGTLEANALQFANASGTALTQSTDFVYRDGQLGIGTSTPSATLTVVGDLSLSGAFFDGLSASGTAGNLLQSTGTSTRWISASAFGDGTFLGLTDTPSVYATSGILFANASSTALVQSNNFVFSGGNLGVGTANPLTRVSVAGGDVSIGEANAIRFYDADDSQYVGFRASTTLGANTVWTLPTSDGSINQLLVTDGNGNLRFADIASVGGGATTYLDLFDTPSSFLSDSIPFVNASGTVLTQASNFVFRDGNLGVGVTNPSDRLSVEGGVRFQLSSASDQLGLTYGESGNNRFGFGTDNPTDFVTIQGGSLAQQGGVVGNTYQPEITGNLELTSEVNDIALDGNFAYVVTNASTNNFRVIDITNPASPVLVTSITLPTGGLSVRMVGRYAYVGGTFAGDGFYIVDVLNPTNPVLERSIAVSTDVRDIVVAGQYAYLAIGSFVRVFDITDPANPFQVASTSVSDNINGLTVAGSYIYAVSAVADEHFHVFDISDPLAIANVADLDLGTAANNVVVRGRYAYVAQSSPTNSFRIINIQEPTAPVVLSSESLGTTANTLQVAGRYVYVGTQAGGDTFYVLDIQNPNDPVLVGRSNLNSGNILGIETRGRYAYLVSSSLNDRFQIIDISGAELQSAVVHSLEGGTLSLQGEAQVAGRLNVLGIRAGLEGLQTDGILSVLGTGRSQIAGSLSIGTSSSLYQLTVAGDVGLTGSLYDSTGNAGSLGMILRSTSTGIEWIATSTLGFSDQTLLLGAANQIPFINGGGDDFSYSSNLTFNGSTLIVTGDILPGTTLAYSLGGAANRFQNVWTETLNVGTSTWSIFNGNDGRLAISDAAEQGGVERLTILTNGNVGVGTTTPNEQLTVAGTIQTTNLLGGATDLVTDAQGNIIRGASDERLKQNITDIEDPLEIILGLRGVRYQWVDTERFGEQTEIGFLAQEVQTVLPEVVREGGEYWSLRTANIVAVVVEAIKSLWAELQGTQIEVTELRERVAELEARLNEDDQPVTNGQTTPTIDEVETEPVVNDLGSVDTSEETTDNSNVEETTEEGVEAAADSSEGETSTDGNEEEIVEVIEETEETEPSTTENNSIEQETEEIEVIVENNPTDSNPSEDEIVTEPELE